MQVYSGGIGSYALLVMVAAFLQSHVSRTPLSAHSRAASVRSLPRESEVLFIFRQFPFNCLLSCFWRQSVPRMVVRCSAAIAPPKVPRPHVILAPLVCDLQELDPCLGVLLLDFFRLYGRSLYAEYVGVSCRWVTVHQIT